MVDFFQYCSPCTSPGSHSKQRLQNKKQSLCRQVGKMMVSPRLEEVKFVAIGPGGTLMGVSQISISQKLLLEIKSHKQNTKGLRVVCYNVLLAMKARTSRTKYYIKLQLIKILFLRNNGDTGSMNSLSIKHQTSQNEKCYSCNKNNKLLLK